MPPYDEAELAKLIAALPPAPATWVAAAQEIPLARQRLDEIVSRAVEDAEFRRALVADLEGALEREGYEPDSVPLDELRRRLGDD